MVSLKSMVEIAKGINKLLRLFNSVKLTAHLGFLNIAGCRPRVRRPAGV